MCLEWRPVVGFEGKYEVSNHGDIRSRKTGHYRILKSRINKLTGYRFIILGYDGKSSTKTIHRIVAEAFVPNPCGLNVVNHIDENKLNNDASNLEWCDIAHNNRHSSYKRRKSVLAYEPDGVLIAKFNSIETASRFLGVTKAAVSMALKGDRSSCAGFVLKSGGDMNGSTDSCDRSVRLGQIDQPA